MSEFASRVDPGERIMSVGGYDGMHLIYAALKKTDGDSLIAAMKEMKLESPRGPISIDPETRETPAQQILRI